MINDGSPQEFEIPSPKWLKLTTVPHNERVIALGIGMKKARGEWMCFLDADDELEPFYLEKINEAIEQYPEYKMFNFGCRYIHKDGTQTTRDAFKPKERDVGHEIFGGGNIVNGTFVWHHSVYDDLGGYPPPVIKDIDCTEVNYGGVRDLHMNTPFDYSAYMQVKYPELRQFFMVDHEAEPHKIIKELGNPWGQDFGIWYIYTRKYKSKPIEEYLYVVHAK